MLKIISGRFAFEMFINASKTNKYRMKMVIYGKGTSFLSRPQWKKNCTPGQGLHFFDFKAL